MYSRAFLYVTNNHNKDKFWRVMCKIIKIRKIKKHNKDEIRYNIDRQYVYDMGDYIDNITAVNYMKKSHKRYTKVYGVVEHISLNDKNNTITLLLKANNEERIAANLQKCEFDKIIGIDKGSIIKVCGTPVLISKYKGVNLLELNKAIIYGNIEEREIRKKKKTKWITL